MPGLVQAATNDPKAPIDVLLVSYDLQTPKADPVKARERVEKFVRARGWGFDVVLLSAANIEQINERFDLPGPIPVTLAFDKDGRSVDREEGEAGVARFRELVQRALGK